jgi:hypothetical protein
MERWRPTPGVLAGNSLMVSPSLALYSEDEKRRLYLT